MKNNLDVVTYFLAVLLLVVGVLTEYVVLDDNGPVVSGANITIWATVYTDDHEIASGKFKYMWEDDALPKHLYTDVSTSPYAIWNVSYPSPQYYPSIYLIQVKVDVKPHWYIETKRCSQRRYVSITDLLEGDLHIHQNNTPTSDSNFVSSKQPVTFAVEMHQPDMDFLRNQQISCYWFIDCHYYGAYSNYSFNYTFKDIGKDHDIDVVVVASVETPAPITSTTSTFTTSTTTTTTTTLASPSKLNTTTLKPNNYLPTTSPKTPVIDPNSTVSLYPNNRSSASINTIASATVLTPTEVIAPQSTANKSEPLTPPGFAIPFVCLNSTDIPRDDNKTYGNFRRKISVRAPVESLAYTGTNWIQPGDTLNLTVSCNGSGSFEYCAYTESADYNITGNEKCLQPLRTENCTFLVTHFTIKNVTMVIVVSNVLSVGVLGVKINMYSAQKHGQLSVIIVPVTCSIIAAVLIVFGVAYYIQSRARFTVEIADFDFGQTDDLEYKTFGERLRDAVNNAVNRVEILDEENTTDGGEVKYDRLQ